MIYTEITTKRTRSGRPIEKVRVPFEDEIFNNEGGRVVQMYGKVISYYFRTLKAVWWYVGYPNEQHIEDIAIVD